MAIDPAQSFSNALGQGLGIMKSYRDEARGDEDRTFDKMMRERAYQLQEKTYGLAVRGDNREQGRYDFLNSPEMRGYETTAAKGDADFKVASAKEAGVKADRANDIIDTDINATNSNATSNRISANASASNAYTNRLNYGLNRQQYRDTRSDTVSSKTLIDSLKALTSFTGPNANPAAAKQIMGNGVVASQVIKMAALASDAPLMESILKNPYGNWINNVDSLRAARRFATFAPVVKATMQQQGFLQGTKIIKFRGHTENNPQGKPQQLVELTFQGPTAGGKTKTYVGYVRPEKLFEPAAMASNLFSNVNRDPVAKQRLVQAFMMSDEKGFNMVLNNEVQRIDGLISTYGSDRKYQVEVASLRDKKSRLLNGDAATAADVVFSSLGRIGSGS
jgi:hypothetical protein